MGEVPGPITKDVQQLVIDEASRSASGKKPPFLRRPEVQGGGSLIMIASGFAGSILSGGDLKILIPSVVVIAGGVFGPLFWSEDRQNYTQQPLEQRTHPRENLPEALRPDDV